MFEVTVQQMVMSNQALLSLTWWDEKHQTNRVFPKDTMQSTGCGVIAYLNSIHPHRIQVVGPLECAYLAQLSPELLERTYQRLIRPDLVAVVMTDGAQPPDSLVRHILKHKVPFLKTPLEGTKIINSLRYWLSDHLAEEIAVHGVFMVVSEVGVLLTGEAMMGKSELALELISLGHGLVADDMVEFRKIGPATLQGRCPEMLRDFLEVRGLGLINIRSVYGETAVRPYKNLRLNVHLEPITPEGMGSVSRLPENNLFCLVLGVEVPKTVIPVAVGRNLAVLVEAATRNFILQQRGIDSTQQFIERQAQVLYETPDGYEG